MFAAWQWWNLYEATAPGGKSLLGINLDETSICVFQGDIRGNIFVSRKRQREEITQNVSRAARRRYFTHVALICNRPEIQALLPQVIIANTRTIPARSTLAIRRALPANIRLVRQKSAWNNELLCSTIVRWLRQALQPVIHRFQPVLIFDSVPLHTAPRVLSACASTHIWPLLVPPLTTDLIQPLDVYAFSLYKHDLQSEYQAARVGSDNMGVDLSTMLRCIGAATEHVIQSQPWGDAFRKTGFGNNQADVGPRVLDKLELDHAPLVPHFKPSVALVSYCLPRGSSAAADLLRPHELTINPPGPSVARGPVAAEASVNEDEVGLGMLGRTRSLTRARMLLSHAVPLRRPARRKVRSPRTCAFVHASNICRLCSRTAMVRINFI